MRIGLVGCGYVADFYLATLRNYPNLKIAGVYDHDIKRLTAFARHHAVPIFDTYEQMLTDTSVELVVNLTNPASHFEVSERALLAGKHVYSEKPLALDLTQAQRLADLARQRNLTLSGAPSSVLGGTAQTVDHLLRKGRSAARDLSTQTWTVGRSILKPIGNGAANLERTGLPKTNSQSDAPSSTRPTI